MPPHPVLIRWTSEPGLDKLVVASLLVSSTHLVYCGIREAVRYAWTTVHPHCFELPLFRDCLRMSPLLRHYSIAVAFPPATNDWGSHHLGAISISHAELRLALQQPRLRSLDFTNRFISSVQLDKLLGNDAALMDLHTILFQSSTMFDGFQSYLLRDRCPMLHTLHMGVNPLLEIIPLFRHLTALTLVRNKGMRKYATQLQQGLSDCELTSLGLHYFLQKDQISALSLACMAQLQRLELKDPHVIAATSHDFAVQWNVVLPALLSLRVLSLMECEKPLSWLNALLFFSGRLEQLIICPQTSALRSLSLSRDLEPCVSGLISRQRATLFLTFRLHSLEASQRPREWRGMFSDASTIEWDWSETRKRLERIALAEPAHVALKVDT
jgi:hypothetical protein